MAKRVDELKIARFRYLEHLWEIAEGSTRSIVNRHDVGDAIGLDEKTCNLVTDYLRAESLLDYVTMDGGIGITHYGIVEIEDALTNPNKSTEHFLPVSYAANFVVSVGQMVNSQISQGSPNSVQSNAVTWQQPDELRALVGALAKSIEQLGLSAEKQRELQAELDTIQAQLRSSAPKKSIVTECLRSMRNILEGAAGSVLASSLVSQVTALMLK